MEATNAPVTTMNNMKLTTRLSGRCKYVFVDSSDHKAERFLIGALIPVSFEYVVERRAGQPYELRVCSFECRYEAAFLECMADLELAMFLAGNDDYPAFCRALLGKEHAA